MELQLIANSIHNKLIRIRHKDKRYARLNLEFFEAQGQKDLFKINAELNKIIDEIEKREVQEFGS